MKERLTGAIILVVLVVALVPELLSGPKPAPPPKLVTTEDGAPIRSVTIDLAEPSAPASAPTAAPSPVAPSPVAPNPAADVGPASAALPQIPAPASPSPPPSAPTPSPPPPTTAPTTSKPAANGESFVVQAGTFSSRANATRLAEQLSAKGLSARVSPFKSGSTELYRVRVGPAGDRAAALSVLARVKAAGSGGTVVPN